MLAESAETAPVTRKQLRQFGLIMGVFIALLFGIIFPWLHGGSLPWEPSYSAPAWIWGIAGVFWSLALIAPRLLGPVYTIWMKIGAVLSWVNTRIILGLVFYGMVTPMAAIMRLLKHDPMARSLDASLASYRNVRPSPAIDMEKPY
ncbi:MAG: SxtJ family membrane protein [Elainellaceae cyanobacterium]